MGRKKAEITCPWLSDYRGSGTILDESYVGDIYCTRDKCALFDTWVGECSFLSIAHALRRDIIKKREEGKEKHDPRHKGGVDANGS